MTTICLCEDCNFYSCFFSEIEKHTINKHSRTKFQVIHTTTNLKNEILGK